MTEGESFFSQGRLDEALNDYQKALELDPKLYHAALFAAMCLSRKGFRADEVWYQRAIAIDRTEDCLSLSATPLMKQVKLRLRAIGTSRLSITEPYNQFARAGLIPVGASHRGLLWPIHHRHPDRCHF